MRILFILFVILVLILAAAPAPATHCQTGYQSYVAPVQASYYAPAVNYYPHPIVQYGVSFRTYDNSDLEKTVLKLQVEVLELKLQQLKAQSGGPEVLPLKQPLALQAECGSCHADGKAAKSGDGFILLKGGSIEHLTLEQVMLSVKHINEDTMPKGRKLPPERKAELIKDLLK